MPVVLEDNFVANPAMKTGCAPQWSSQPRLAVT